jgi:hypothetical protein
VPRCACLDFGPCARGPAFRSRGGMVARNGKSSPRTPHWSPGRRVEDDGEVSFGGSPHCYATAPAEMPYNDRGDGRCERG